MPDRKWELAAGLLLLAVFVALGAAYIDRPGFYYDEVIFVPVSLTILGEGGFSVAMGYSLFGMPVTQSPVYVGALKAWIMAPVFELFGVNHATVRLPMVVLTEVAFGIAWAFLRPRLGRAGALAVLALSTTDPALIQLTRLDWGPVAVSGIAKLLMLAAFVRFVETGRGRWVALAAAAAALALWDKAHFIWTMIAVATAGGLFFGREMAAWLRRDRLRAVALLAPFVAVYAAIGLFIVLPSRGIGDSGQPFGWDFLAGRWDYVLNMYVSTFQGHSFFGWVFRDNLPVSALAPSLIGWQMAVGAVVGVLALAGPLRDNAAARWAGFLTTAFAVTWVQVVATPQATGAHHMPVFWPFATVQLVLLIGLAAGGVRRLARAAGPGMADKAGQGVRVVGGLAVAVLVASALRVDGAYLTAMERNAGYSPLFDPGIGDLSRRLVERAPDRVVSGDWGILFQLITLAPPERRAGHGDHWPNFIGAETSAEKRRFVHDWLFAGQRTALILPAEGAAVMAPAVAGAEDFLRRMEACVVDRGSVDDVRGRPLWRFAIVDSRERSCAAALSDQGAGG